MKYFCYFILIIAFLMFFQASPLYAFVVLAIIIGVIFLVKRGKNSNSPRSVGMFRSSRYPAQDNINTLLMANMTLLQPAQPPVQYSNNASQKDETEAFSQDQMEILSILEVKSSDRQ